ncbi:MAG: hypothetical protein AAB690_02580 [Patescibacteria group bacterium]
MKRLIPLALVALMPILTFAAGTSGEPTLGNLQTLIRSIGKLVDLALPVVVGIALLGFFWGLATYIFAGGDAEKQKDARSRMIWGVVALFVMVSVWGLVRFIGSAVGVTEGGTQDVPDVTGLVQ